MQGNIFLVSIRNGLTWTPPRIMRMRDFLLPLLILVGTIRLTSHTVAMIFIVGGQAHFFMAYLYQYRGGKMNRLYLFTALALAVLGISYFVFLGSPILISLIAGIIFGTHFAIDEITLHENEWRYESVVTVLNFVVLYSVILLNMVYPIQNYTHVVQIVLVCGMLVRLATRNWPSASERYLWFIMVVLSILTFLPSVLTLGRITNFVIVLHFFNWCIGYGIKVRGSSIERRYWIETVVTYLLCTALYYVYVFTNEGSNFLQYFFNLTYWYLWAVAHVVLSWIVSLSGRPKILAR